jgi:hypothetical protein
MTSFGLLLLRNRQITTLAATCLRLATVVPVVQRRLHKTSSGGKRTYLGSLALPKQSEMKFTIHLKSGQKNEQIQQIRKGGKHVA